MTAQELATRLHGAKLSGTQWSAFCPAHEDHEHPSLSFCDEGDKVLIKCHAGCSAEAVAEACGVGMRDLFHDAPTTAKTTRRIAAMYDYMDLNGKLLYQAIRYDPKGFRQRRPDGAGGWIYNLNSVRRIPFKYPDLAGSATVYNVEGEKDVLTLWALGLPATCNSGGAGKWTDDLTAQLVEIGVREVVILPDNDRPGQKHGKAVARSCRAAGLMVRVCRLPGLPPVRAKHGEDVTDWLESGHTSDELRAALAEAPEADAPDLHSENTSIDSDDHRPVLDCDEGDLHAVTQEAWKLVAASNNPPTLFCRGNFPVRVERDDSDRCILMELGETRLRHELARMTHCVKTKFARNGHPLGREACRPPLDVVRNMLAAALSDIPLPVLDAVIEVPTVSCHGQLVRTPGYDPMSQLLYAPYDPAIDLAIPDDPTHDDLTWARALIDELLANFPFSTEADRTNTIGCLLLAFVRPFIEDPTPLHLFEAPTPGTGKTLLADVVTYPAVGSHAGVIADARDDDEMRKRITARLREGCPVTLFDNITRPMDSGIVSAAITAKVWEDRRLGKNETLRIPVSTIWMMTANNPQLSLEIARRTVRIRLDSRRDRPWERDGFLHPNLLGWVHRERAALIRAALILIQRWLRAGQPTTTTKPLGSFEAWSRVIGGILQHSGYEDFMANRQDLYEEADAEGVIWRAFVGRWWATYQTQVVGTAELFPIAGEVDGFPLGKATTERGQKTALGMQIRKRRDQVIGDVAIKAGPSSNNAGQWRLLPVMASSPPPRDASELIFEEEVC